MLNQLDCEIKIVNDKDFVFFYVHDKTILLRKYYGLINYSSRIIIDFNNSYNSICLYEDGETNINDLEEVLKSTFNESYILIGKFTKSAK